MTALAADRNTPSKHMGRSQSVGVADSETIYKGALVAASATGYLIAAAKTNGIRVIGVAEETVDNSAGSDGDLSCRIRHGVFRFVNGTEAVAVADVGLPCYVEDDQTVVDEGEGSQVVAGTVVLVDDDGVWIAVGDNMQGIVSGIETVTVGAISLLTRTTLLSVTGTKAYTLADGLFEGQRKSLYCTVAASTPDGTITPVTLNGGTTLDVDAVSESYELEWHDTGGWQPINITGGAIS